MFLSFAQQFFLQFSSIHLNRDHEFSLKGFETNRTITNASEYCHHILFDTPGLSREDPPQFSKGLCPDTWSTFYTTLFFLIIYTLSVSFGIFGVIWKRKNGFITSRNPSHMILTMSIGYLFALLLALRFLIGRKIFPCALYTITFFTVPAALCLPTVLRLARLHFMYRLNLLKTKLFDDAQSQVTSGSSSHDLCDKSQSMNTELRLTTEQPPSQINHCG